MRLVLFFVFTVSALSRAQAVLVDGIAATVHNRAITRSMVDERVRQGAPSRAVATEALIDEALIDLDAQRLLLEVSPAEVDRALKDIIDANAVTPEEFARALVDQGYTLASYREALRLQVLSLRWVMIQSGTLDLPAGAAQRADFYEAQKRRLLAALRERTVIEVRP